MTHWTDSLPYRPCNDALEWLRTQPDAATAWATCDRGDWMLYHAGKLAGDPGSDKRRQLVLAACACARLAIPHVPAGEQRPLVAIETAEAWARGGRETPSIDDVLAADADAAAAAAYAAAAADAADAAYAAYAAAAYAAYAAYAARAAVLSQCADIVRGFYPQVPM